MFVLCVSLFDWASNNMGGFTQLQRLSEVFSANGSTLSRVGRWKMGVVAAIVIVVV